MVIKMEKVLEFIKKNKVKIIVLTILIIIIIVGVFLFLDYKNKEYALTEVSEYKYYQLNEEGKYGVIDVSGNIVIEPIYESVKIPNPEKSVFICTNENKTIVLNENKEEIFTEYEEVTAIPIKGVVSSIPYEKRVLKYKSDGKYGLIDYNGKVITKPIYEEIEGMQNKESVLLVKQDGKYGAINDKGAKLIEPKYDEIIADGFYTEENKYGLSGYIVKNTTQDGYRYGYINYKLEKVLDVEYNSINRILDTEGTDIYIIAVKNGKYGVIKNNKVLIDYTYQGIEYDDTNKVFQVQRNSKYGIADINGKEVIPVDYTKIEFNGIYLKAFKNEEEYAFFDAQGNEIENSKYTTMLKTTGDNYYITVNEDSLYGVINSDKKELIQNKYNYIEYLFGEYFIAARDDGYLGVINTKDKVVVDFKYEVLQKVDDINIIEAKILKENKLELYANNLEKICSMNNANIYKDDEYIKVYSENETKYFDFNGNEINPKDLFKNNNLFASQADGKWGFVDKQGNIIVEYIYDRVTEFNEYGFAGIKKDGKWGVINKEGNIILEPTYQLQEENSEPEFLGIYYKVYYGYGESYYTNQVNE